MNPVAARSVLFEAGAILQDVPFKWWLSSGTALGAYRDNLSDEFLEHDTDLDIGVMGDQAMQIYHLFEDKGYTIFREYAIHFVPVQMAFVKNDIILDFYFWYPNIEQTHIETLTEHGLLRKPHYLFHTLGSWNGLPMPMPIEQYLDMRYHDWRTPNRTKVPWETVAKHLVKGD